MKKNTIFGQIVQLLSRREFKKIVDSYDGDKFSKRMDCWQQLMILLYAQMKDLVSLRDIETAINSRKDDWIERRHDPSMGSDDSVPAAFIHKISDSI